MSKSLVIVESPAKIKTLKKLLGPTFIFESSYGHVRDLPEKEFGIDVENQFEPKYVLLSKKTEVVDRLKEAAKECDTIYLAPDPDREGEAIAWHISQILPKDANIKRISFQSITRDAVQEAIKNPTTLNLALVNAQQARRLLDRLVGYSISPLLNKRLRRGRGKGVSAGRVQSVALKLVVDREKEIEAFIPKEYWTIAAKVQPGDDKPFTAALSAIDGIRVEKEQVGNKVEGTDFVLVNNAEKAKAIREDLEKATYIVTRVDRKEKKRNPEAPFITSTMQQEASRHYRFSPSRTMEIAQGLYEGIELGSDGAEGLITYMRTDSVRVAPEAIEEARSYIGKEFGKDYLPDSPRNYSVKKSAQDAHEAIRPASVMRHPDQVKQYLTKEQYLLYSLIWKRFLASQMVPAIYDTVSVDIQADIYTLRATGSQIKFRGFLTLYEEKSDEEQDSDEDKLLPNLSVDQLLSLLELTGEQSFTRPPARFTEATLIKELEKSGIGRPSTYATIMKKIESRDYTVKEQSRLKPTELGRVICELLELNFKTIMETAFTAHMEDDLEEVAEDKKNWKVLLAEFWATFAPTMAAAEENAIVPKIPTDTPCPKCGGMLQKVWSKDKYFLGCEHYPECDYTISVEESTFDKNDYKDGFDYEQPCPKCKAAMKLRFGRFGAFLGCTSFPECRGVVRIPKKGEPEEEPLPPTPCPAVGCTGELVKRRSRFGKTFIACSEYPDCDVIGNSLEIVMDKYQNREKTAYVGKPKGKKGAKGKEEKAPAKKKATKKKATGKKATTKKAATKKAPVKTATKETDTETVTAKKAPVKKAAVKKTVKKTAVKKAPSKKKVEKATSSDE